MRCETQKYKNKKSRRKNSLLFNEQVFSGWMRTRLFATKRIFEAVEEPNKLYTERGLLDVTKALW